ncbi:hypothetical protein OC861_000494 [Tilletia horrida]|nr:hypothetical protein OC861_000494 [Tilletia horrida]
MDDEQSGNVSQARSSYNPKDSADQLPFIPDELDDDVPDEDLDTTSGKHQLWLVKVPPYLMNEWNRVKAPDIRLGTVRVYDELDASGKQRMELLLPEDWQPGTSDITSPPTPSSSSTSHKRKASEIDTKPRSGPGNSVGVPKVYDLKLAPYDAASANLYAFREQWEGDQAPAAGESKNEGESRVLGLGSSSAESSRSRKRPRVTTALIGCVANETHIQAKVDAKGGVAEEVRQQLRLRRKEAEKKRSIQMLDTDLGTANMLASGVNVGLLKSRFGQFSIAKTNASNKGVDKRARMPKNELLDMLWPMFEMNEHLRLKQIAERVQQPEAYLKDVLAEVADLHKRGPYAGHYSIKAEFKNASSSSGGGGASGSGSGSGNHGSGQGGSTPAAEATPAQAEEEPDFEIIE